MRRARGSNRRGVAQYVLPGVGTPAQLSLCPNADTWTRHEVPAGSYLDALLVEARNRAARGEDPAGLFHRLDRRGRRLFVAHLQAEGLRVPWNADLLGLWAVHAAGEAERAGLVHDECEEGLPWPACCWPAGCWVIYRGDGRGLHWWLADLDLHWTGDPKQACVFRQKGQALEVKAQLDPTHPASLMRTH